VSVEFDNSCDSPGCDREHIHAVMDNGRIRKWCAEHAPKPRASSDGTSATRCDRCGNQLGAMSYITVNHGVLCGSCWPGLAVERKAEGERRELRKQLFVRAMSEALVDSAHATSRPNASRIAKNLAELCREVVDGWAEVEQS